MREAIKGCRRTSASLFFAALLTAAAAAGAPAAAPPAGRPAPAPAPAGGPPTMTQEWAPHYPGTYWVPGVATPAPGSSRKSGGPLVREGPVAHAPVPGRLAVADQHQVILRDGSALPARSAPQLARGTVRFTDPRGILVSVRASEVDLAATAAANHLAWSTTSPPVRAPAPAPQPASRPH
ncbi:MAG TPA: hypothetical protein VMW75_11740 [Thermoanaerobaculia bacterium]|nr:hypothetical protein [Thermoanaerobaculia bacterium]